jgi:hypothetical protein
LKAQQMLFVAGFDQFADQGGGGGKAYAVAFLAGCQAQGVPCGDGSSQNFSTDIAFPVFWLTIIDRSRQL